MIKQNFIKIYESNFKKNWELPALTNYKDGDTLTYKDLAERIAYLHFLFEKLELQKGDKIALIGKNHSTWCSVFLATITYGGVIVPILHEFPAEGIESIVSHSDSKCVFVNDSIWATLNPLKFDQPVFAIPSFNLLQGDDATQTTIENLKTEFNARYPEGFGKEHVRYAEVNNSELVCLNYTSGTTGSSKGVMLSANNLAGNITYAGKLDLLFKGEKDLAFLPMAHAYGCAFDFLYALSVGVHVTLLDVIPTPDNLVQALKQVKPNLIITVPLIFEKIYKKRILPKTNKPTMKILLKIPILNNIIYKKIRNTLYEALGGNFREIIIGGAALNKEVEAFFYRMKIPFTVGYGMTECAPLISYDHHYDFVPTSCGSVLKGIMEARIDSPDPENIPGEIQVRGENVMMGYYKNPEATQAAFTEDGWLKTGDTGTMRGNRLFIKGRIKTMILSSNGQNIYPEEIEAKLNNMDFVAESLVIERNNTLTALVYPDFVALKANNIAQEDIPQIMESYKNELNKVIAKYEKIKNIEITDKEFEKTPKKSIKRYLYV